MMMETLGIRSITPPVAKISLPDPVDPFGKASGRHLLTMALSLLVHLPEFTPSGFGLYPLHVNKTRHVKPWRIG
jgi:hypothetical protein